MLTLLLVILLLMWFFGYAGPRFYPAYTTRYRRYPYWGNRSHTLLVIVLILVILWALGYIGPAGVYR